MRLDGCRSGAGRWGCRGRGTELSPRGRSWRPGGCSAAAASLSPAPRRPRAGDAGSPVLAHRRLRDWSQEAASRRGKRRGLIWGSVWKLGLGFIFDAGKPVRSGPSITALWAGALAGNLVGENRRFRVVEVWGAAAQCFLREELAGCLEQSGTSRGAPEPRGDAKAFPP